MRKFSTSFTSFYNASKPVSMFGGNVTQCYSNYSMLLKLWQCYCNCSSVTLILTVLLGVIQNYNVIPEGLGEDLEYLDILSSSNFKSSPALL